MSTKQTVKSSPGPRSSRAQQFIADAKKPSTSRKGLAAVLPPEREGYHSLVYRIGNEATAGYLPNSISISEVFIPKEVMATTIGPVLALKAALTADESDASDEQKERMFLGVAKTLNFAVSETVDPDRAAKFWSLVNRIQEVKTKLLEEYGNLPNSGKELCSRIAAASGEVVTQFFHRVKNDMEIAKEFRIPLYVLKRLFNENHIDLKQPKLFERLLSQKFPGFGLTIPETLSSLEAFRDLAPTIRLPNAIEVNAFRTLVSKLNFDPVQDPVNFAKSVAKIFPFVQPGEIAAHFRHPETTIVTPYEVTRVDLDVAFEIWCGVQNSIHYGVQLVEPTKAVLLEILPVRPSNLDFTNKKWREAFFDIEENKPVLFHGSPVKLKRFGLLALPKGISQETDAMRIVFDGTPINRVIIRMPPEEGAPNIEMEVDDLSPFQPVQQPNVAQQMPVIATDEWIAASKAVNLKEKEGKPARQTQAQSSLDAVVMKRVNDSLRELSIKAEPRAKILNSLLSVQKKVQGVAIERLEAAISSAMVDKISLLDLEEDD